MAGNTVNLRRFTGFLGPTISCNLFTSHCSEYKVDFTDVDDVSFAVEHDVAIVAVFELQQKCQQTVAGHADDEVASRLQINHSISH